VMRDFESSVEGSLANVQHAQTFKVSSAGRWITPLCVLMSIAVGGLIAWLMS
jgi:hypothetical protein